MLIERFIGHMARKKNENYLKFSPHASYALPGKGANEVPLLMYVHVPFCEELCPYCSFHRVVFREDLVRAYFKALKKEILMYRDLGYDFNALYVGGGTPTVLIDELVETIGLVRHTYDVREISVETNPNHLDDRNMEALKKAGANRLSVGVQTFDDDLLKAVGRYHKYGSGDEIAAKLKSLQGYFDTLNVDMIFNFPTQTREMLARDLSVLLAMSLDQVTYYPLMVSSATKNVMGTRLGVVDDARGGTFYRMIADALEKDYRASTAWCFSRDQAMIDEYVINYDEYAGLGSGSIGYLSGSVYANTFDIEDYIQRIDRGELPIAARRDCNLKEKFLYDFLMKLFGLKLNLDDLAQKHGASALLYLYPEICFFIMTGGIKRQGNTLSLTSKGRYYWVIMMREFFVGVNNFRDYCRTQANLSLAH